MSATIEVKKSAGGDPMTFAVAVREDESETRHDVTLSRAYLARVAPGASAEQAIEAAFRFLLDREPKEAILARFDVSVISRYFPQFETRLPDYLR